jgi:hypothetical protein
VPERLQRQGDPWRDMPRHVGALTRPAQRLGEALAEAERHGQPGAVKR